jgi:hypothetical protein
MKTVYTRHWDGEADAMLQEMVGKTFVRVYQSDSDEELIFVMEDGTKYIFYHDQNCCEGVSIEDVTGDLSDLVGEPLHIAEVSVSEENPPGVEVPEYQDSFTWTFYKFATIKGYVDVRWYGESNGYYSESVDLRKEITD